MVGKKEREEDDLTLAFLTWAEEMLRVQLSLQSHPNRDHSMSTNDWIQIHYEERSRELWCLLIE